MIEPQQTGEKPQLGNLKICPKCGIWCLEFDPHQQAWKCLNKECSAIYRNGVPEVEPKHCKFSETMEARTKPQQTEGELAECPAKACSFKAVLPDGTRFICTAKECAAYEYAQAQRAHDKARMVKLPSEDELALWLCDHLSYTSRGLAQELLLRLLGEKS